MMKLIPNEIAMQIPALYKTETETDPIAYVRLLTPDSCWTWYVFELDPAERLCFGWVEGLDNEWGYFSLEELAEVCGPLGLPIERDLYFKPTPRSILLGKH